MAKQLVVSGNRILAHGEDCFIAMGGTVICKETGKAYQNATVVECDNCPSDIDTVGYEYHAGVFIPCAPYGKGNGSILVASDDCKTPKDSGVPVDAVGAEIVVTSLDFTSEVSCVGETETKTGVFIDGKCVFKGCRYGTWQIMVDGTIYNTVNVDTYMQYVVGIALPVNYLMLYDGSLGDVTLNECMDVTGGWSADGWTSVYPINNIFNAVVKNKDSIFVTVTTTIAGQKTSGVGTTNPIDITDFNTLFAKASKDTVSGKVAGYFTVNESKNFDSDLAAKSIDIGTGPIINSLNVSSINQPAYFTMKTNGTGSRSCYFYNLWLTKPDDWETLASIAGISASSIRDILTNSTTLLANENAVNFMCRSCTGDFMASAITDRTFLTALASSPYRTTVYANVHWSKFLAMVA